MLPLRWIIIQRSGSISDIRCKERIDISWTQKLSEFRQASLVREYANHVKRSGLNFKEPRLNDMTELIIAICEKFTFLPGNVKPTSYNDFKICQHGQYVRSGFAKLWRLRLSRPVKLATYLSSVGRPLLIERSLAHCSNRMACKTKWERPWWGVKLIYSSLPLSLTCKDLLLASHVENIVAWPREWIPSSMRCTGYESQIVIVFKLQ